MYLSILPPLERTDVIILAGGKGKRMNSDKPKVLHKLLGKTLIQHIIDTYRRCDQINQILVVISSELEDNDNLKYADKTIIQKNPQGTAHAVSVALPFVKSQSVIVQNGDVPLVQLNDIKKLTDTKFSTAIVIAPLPKNENAYGRVILDKNNKFNCIVEFKELKPEHMFSTHFNTGFYKFEKKLLEKYLPELPIHGSEYYLPDMFKKLKENNHDFSVIIAENADNFLGINTQKELKNAELVLQNRINNIDTITFQKSNNMQTNLRKKSG